MTATFESLAITLSSFAFLSLLLLALIKIFYKQWWVPIRIKKTLNLQGVEGPSYRLIHGNTKEISNMIKEAMSRPKSLSHDILYQIHPHIHTWSKKYEGKLKTYLQWYGSQSQLIVMDPEMCKEILNDKDRVYRKLKKEGFALRLQGNGLPGIEGEKWLKVRKISMYAFHGESLKAMIPAMIASTETMLKRWQNHEEGKEIEVFEEFRLLTSEVISRTAFGSSYLEGQDIFEMLMKLASFLVKNTYRLRIPGISRFIKTNDEIVSEKLVKGIYDSIIGIVKKREEQAMTMISKEDKFGDDFIGLLLKARYNSDFNQRITVDDLVDECKTFYFAGQETTNTLLAWTILLLAMHPDWQEEARKEVLQLFGKQTPNSDGLTKLKTMSMILNETLRLYPPVVSIIRRVEKEVRLGRIIVPANVELHVPNLAFHHDPQLWGEDVHLFKPERFSEGVAKATNNNMIAYLPFGMGPRNCVGFNFATTEAKIALSMILQRYSFTLSPGYVHSPFRYITVRPQHGVQVMLHPL
ncbi:putative cytochrome P450 [Rosa chinensis]|uniref:Putative cytochrome P450 n=1 Tax=Rosa chinensis TaxID=74649 RepID=A0A2P6R2B4_ROSCH|nr:cytochrome P450 CYP749A22 [Rosa chinensis]PRQ40548.1 putative cytochrome P450 [Rosa chinensis]